MKKTNKLRIGSFLLGINWSVFDSFGTLTVRSAVADPAGDLYFGGSFTTVEGITANYIVKWGKLL